MNQCPEQAKCKTEALGVFHYEEPRPHYDLDGLATVADNLNIPIASGEMIYTHWPFVPVVVCCL